MAVIVRAKKGLQLTAAEKGMSINTLSRKIGVTRTQVSRIANGENTTPDMAGKISKALGQKVTDLFDVTERKE
jgi:plasmid maintenance system antidote protein VapI